MYLLQVFTCFYVVLCLFTGVYVFLRVCTLFYVFIRFFYVLLCFYACSKTSIEIYPDRVDWCSNLQFGDIYPDQGKLRVELPPKL